MHTIYPYTSFALQNLEILERYVDTAGDICKNVVDLFIASTNQAVMSSHEAAVRLGLEESHVEPDALASAETACTVEHRGIQQMLDGSIVEQDNSSTIDLSAATASDLSGAAFVPSQELESCAFSTVQVGCRRLSNCHKNAQNSHLRHHQVEP